MCMWSYVYPIIALWSRKNCCPSHPKHGEQRLCSPKWFSLTPWSIFLAELRLTLACLGLQWCSFHGYVLTRNQLSELRTWARHASLVITPSNNNHHMVCGHQPKSWCHLLVDAFSIRVTFTLHCCSLLGSHSSVPTHISFILPFHK